MSFLPTDLTMTSPHYFTTGSDFPDFNRYAAVPPIPLSFDDEDPISNENQLLYLSRLALQHQQLAERYALFVSQLQEADREAETISKQNTNLRLINEKLYNRLSFPSTKHKFKNPVAGDYPPISFLDDYFRRISLAEPSDEASPTSVLGFQNHRICRSLIPSPSAGDKRIALPKSISVRSAGYLKIQDIAGAISESHRKIKHRPIRPTTPVMQQKVRLEGGEEGGKAENDDIEVVDVFGQGAFKTELCNKWQESGECPYGEHCQFAHGFGELRPIIRHPRYKTELCRMVLTGDACPYGHRCHFRHVIFPHDRLLMP